MTDEEVKIYIKQTVEETITECKKKGLLKFDEYAAYKEVSSRLKKFYKTNQKDKALKSALKSIQLDPYYKMILMHYRDGDTLEYIAEKMECDYTTIMRNKKRLCLELYEELL